MNKKLFVIPFAMLSMGMAEAQNSIDLAGQWQVGLDSLQTFQAISLPGNLDLAGLGTPNTLTPALAKPQLLHLTRKHSFVGATFYRRTIDISKEMENKPLTLTLERIIWQSQVWVDGKKLNGEMESLTTPHVYTLSDGLKAGRHEIFIRIDNRKRYDMSTKEMAHAYTDETQVKWNGILGKMTLKAENPVKVFSIQTFPNVKDKSVKVVTKLVRTLAKSKKYKGMLSFDVTDATPGAAPNIAVYAYAGDAGRIASFSFPVTVDQDTVTVEKTLALGDNVKFWDEFSPYIYGLKASFSKGNNLKSKSQKASDLMDTDSTTFGMREISVKNGHFAVNGNRIFLRGTLECCLFPLTGCPPTDEVGWEKVFRSAKSWGLNHLRFHSYCPPEAAFRVADRMGFYLQIELPVWSLTIGKDPSMNRFLYDEYNRITANYGNHPSFCLLSAGNELQPDFKFLNNFVSYMKQHDPRHLYTTTSFTFEKGHGRKPEPEDQYFVTQWTDKGWVRGQGVFDAERPNFNKDYRQATVDIHTPLVSHEIGQYSVYPNLQEIKKYTGTLDPLNFKAIRDDLQKKVLLDKADDYLKASGKLAVQLYKEEIERAMKTPKFDGFQLLGLQDFSGQGTALVGLVDAFWDSKGLTSERYFCQFNAPVTPLARFEKATWGNNEKFLADVEIANYGKNDITGKSIAWMLKDAQGKTMAQGETTAQGKVIAQGELAAKSILKGDVTPVGTIETSLADVKEATQLTLQVSIKGTEWMNTWNIWVYPSELQMPKTDVVMTQDIDVAMKALKKGKRVLLSPKKECIKGLEGKFLPVFWSPVHFPKQAGTMGLLVNPQHPALAHFPTEMHSNWQWWHLVKRSRVMNIDSIKGATPIIEDVDNFTNNRRLCSMFEAKCGKGKLIVSSMDVLSDNEGKPEVKQMLYSLLCYIKSQEFNPSGVVSFTDLVSLWDGKQVGKSTSATSIYE